MVSSYDYSPQQISTNFMYKVYGWMAGALALTGVTAYVVSNTQLARTIVTNPGLLLVLLLLQLGLVIFLSFFIQKMSLTTASLAFVIYSVVTGVVFSTLFLVYTQESLAATFAITAGMFAIMALYGYYTQADLTQLGNILMMALIGLVIAMLVNLFLRSSAFNYVISGIGVIIFSGLTAYDAQRIKELSSQMLGDGQERSKVAILGALTLYLDFINLFLMLLSFTGKRQE